MIQVPLAPDHALNMGISAAMTVRSSDVPARSPLGLPIRSRLSVQAPSLYACGWGDLAEASMADADDVRRLALALPHVEEIDSDGFDFRVAGKGFVWSYPERRPGRRRVIRTDIAVLFVGDEAEKQALLLGEPGIFFTTPGYDGWPLVMLRLAMVDAERLAELVTDAWRMRAPEALTSELDQSGG